MSKHRYHLGILGGGQLARMMIPTVKKWDLSFSILDQEKCVCAPLCRNLKVGDFKSDDDVFRLMRDCEVVTYDLESISLAGLKRLEDEGVTLRPSLKVMETIQDKGKQKDFFKHHGIPTADYRLVDDHFEELPRGFIKLRQDGYDGRGVLAWKPGNEYPQSFKKPVVWEEKVAIDRELSVLVVRGQDDQVVVYEPVEMVFNEELNLIDYTLFPGRFSDEVKDRSKQLARQLARQLELVGLMAVELFLTREGELLVNELAPRPHNSGHHTIESHVVSQFENHVRATMMYPLGEAKATVGAALTFNLLGSGTGVTEYRGVEKLLAYSDVHLHLYGKDQVRVGRKMGHVTITGATVASVVEKYRQVKDLIVVTSKDS